MDTWLTHSRPESYIQEFPYNEKAIFTRLSQLDLQANDRFIDLGCGSGYYVFVASKRVAESWGIDISPHLIQYASQFNQGQRNVVLINSALQDAEWTESYFSKGYARNSLCYLSLNEKRSVIEKMAFGFENGALFLLEDVMLFPGWEKALRDCLAGKPGLLLPTCLLCPEEHDVHPLKVKPLKDMFVTAGFEVLSITRLGFGYGAMLFRKI